MSDIFREVEEDLRHEKYKRLWDKYGPYVLAVAFLIVAGTAGYRGWEAWEASRSETTGDQYINALQSADDGEIEDAEKALSELSVDAPGGYSDMARLRAASIKAQNDDAEGALKAFTEIAKDGGVAPVFQNAARIQAGYILVDNADFAEVEKQLSGLAANDNAWRHSARELIGLAAYKAEKYEDAQKWFQQVIDDRAAPADLSARAQVMLSLIQAEIKPSTSSSQSDGAGEDGKKNGEEK